MKSILSLTLATLLIASPAPAAVLSASGPTERLREAKLELALEQFKRLQTEIFEIRVTQLLLAPEGEQGQDDAVQQRLDKLSEYAQKLEGKIRGWDEEHQAAAQEKMRRMGEQEEAAHDDVIEKVAVKAEPATTNDRESASEENASKDFPGGIFHAKLPDGKSWSLNFDDGVVRVKRDGELGIKATYEIDGAELVIKEETGPLAQGGGGPGRYHWQLNDEGLSFEKIDDANRGRAKALTSLTWERK